jgi:translation initiation factor 2 alpha subunit (eIF-2alpha)
MENYEGYENIYRRLKEREHLKDMEVDGKVNIKADPKYDINIEAVSTLSW